MKRKINIKTVEDKIQRAENKYYKKREKWIRYKKYGMRKIQFNLVWIVIRMIFNEIPEIFFGLHTDI